MLYGRVMAAPKLADASENYKAKFVANPQQSKVCSNTPQFASAVPVPVKTRPESQPKGSAAPAGHKRLTINLPESLHKKLRLKAIEQGTTATDIIERLLEQGLA